MFTNTFKSNRLVFRTGETTPGLGDDTDAIMARLSSLSQGLGKSCLSPAAVGAARANLGRLASATYDDQPVPDAAILAQADRLGLIQTRTALSPAEMEVIMQRLLAATQPNESW